jgi:glycosyltransferase involved in cell wall biosynthesis
MMPKVSVVIPTKNRSALLAEAVERIESQTVSREHYEVIVIDNDSNDDTRTVLEQKAKTYRNFKFGVQEKPGAAATRNAGLRLARGDLILFIDDDVQAEPSLVEAHLDTHQKNPSASVIGAVSMPWGDTSDPFLRYLRDHRILNPYTPSKGRIDFSYYHTCNVSTPTQMLMNVGGFNENFDVYGMEDIELGYRLEKAGSRMMFAPDARAIHHRFPGYQDFVERSEQAGYSLGHLIRLHPELKNRFVDSCRVARHLKGVHSLYRWAATAMSPIVTLITNWEKTRGTTPLTWVLDAHYNWSIRYYFFLGYHRYWKDQSRIRQDLASSSSAMLPPDVQRQSDHGSYSMPQ